MKEQLRQLGEIRIISSIDVKDLWAYVRERSAEQMLQEGFWDDPDPDVVENYREAGEALLGLLETDCKHELIARFTDGTAHCESCGQEF